MGAHDRSASPLWTDTATKWRLYPEDARPAGADTGQEDAVRAFDRARAALLAGRVAEAGEDFLAAAGARDNALDHVGIGDVAAARGDWSGASESYERAKAIDGDDPIVRIGLAQARIARGDAWSATERLGAIVEEGAPPDAQRAGLPPGHPVSRYYLAAALLAAADQVRGRTRDEVPVFTHARQLDLCAGLATRALALRVDAAEVNTQARRLLDEVAAGRRWTWDSPSIPVYAVLSVLGGLGVVVAGGLLGSVALVIAGVAFGPGMICWLVITYRREAWRRTAERLAPLIWRRGVAD